MPASGIRARISGTSQPTSRRRSAQQLLLRGDVVQGHVAVMAEREAEHRRVVAEREPKRLHTHLRMRHRNELVTRTIPLDVEHRDHDPQVALELGLRPEHQFPHPRVQTVRTDHQVELPRVAMNELDAHPIAVVVERLNGVPKIVSTSPSSAS